MDLGNAIKVLDGTHKREPTAALSETVVVKTCVVCTSLPTSTVNHDDVKRTLAEWIAKVAPDDFDTSCTRM
ncbi:hypothetical protein ACP70R_038542 [Stipagrostis hirtigluma subsp. patula]